MKAPRSWSVLALIVLILAVSAASAQNPRAPVYPLDRGGSTNPPPQPTPTPQPLPSPIGVYSGPATVTIQGQPTFTQTWRVVLKPRSCPECAPGQYWLNRSNFDSVIYSNGKVERGGVYGSVNPDGTGIAFQLFAFNCLYVDPSQGANAQSSIWGGSFGTLSGQKITIRDGRITGWMSGYDCFDRPVNVTLNLQRQTQTVPSDCAFQGGWYYGTFANSRGQSGGGWIYLYQSDCYISGRADDGSFSIDGVFTGPSGGTFKVGGVGNCQFDAQGTGTLQSNGTIVGNYSGSVGNGCSVAPGAISGSFTVSPQ